MQEKLAEARSAKTLYDRCASSFQYGRVLDCMVEASESAEHLADRLRRLVLGNPYAGPRKEEYCLGLVQIHGIDVEYEDHILKARLPFLLPHRKNKYTDYIYKPFFLALQNWCMERRKGGKEIPVYEQATVCFVHEYNQRLPKSRVRDHDNIEEKQVVDALGTYFLMSDNGLYLDTYHTTTMTGDQIVKILQSSFEDEAKLQSTFTCFVTSGLKVEYATWAGTGEHMVKVTNADGSEFDLDKTYSVSYCNGYFTMQGSSSTEVTAPIIPGLKPEKVYQESIVELLGPVVQADGELKPFTDGRLVLNWEVR